MSVPITFIRTLKPSPCIRLYSNIPLMDDLFAAEWSVPEWIDKAKMEEGMKRMGAQGVVYGDSLSYRHMCRYYSGVWYPYHGLNDAAQVVEPRGFELTEVFKPFLVLQDFSSGTRWF
jgi:hypothetical protein